MTQGLGEHAHTLLRQIYTAHHLMMRLCDRLAGPAGLTGSRWLLLHVIDHHAEPPTVSRLAEMMLLSVQNVSRMLSAMEGEGLVQRVTRRGRGRAVFVSITPAGRRALERAEHLEHGLEAAVRADMGEAERRRLEDMLDVVITNLAGFEQQLDELDDRPVHRAVGNRGGEE